MKELMLFMGKALPKDFIIEELEKAINDWKADQTDGDKWRKIEMYSHLILSKAISETEGGIEKAIQMMDRAERGYKLITPESQQ